MGMFGTTIYGAFVGNARREAARAMKVRHASSAAPAVAPELSKETRALYTRISKKWVGLNRDVNVDEVGAKIENIVSFFETRLKIPKMKAIRAVALHPMLMTYTPDVMNDKLDWLHEIGMTTKMAATAIQRHPCIIGRSEESYEATKVWFTKRGLDPKRIAYIFTVFPQATSMTNDTLDLKVAALEQIGLDDDQIRRVLQRFPQVLRVATDTMHLKVKWATEWGLPQENVVDLITTVPEFLSLSMEQVAIKLAAIEELFGEGEALRIWVQTPRVVMANAEQLRRAFMFLTTEVGIPRERLRATLVMRNVDRVLRPRYEFLTKSNVKNLDFDPYWILMTDVHFKKRHDGYEEFLQQRG